MPVAAAAALSLVDDAALAALASTPRGSTVESMNRSEFVEEFNYRQEPGQHAVFFGPTGRGKSTLMADLLHFGSPCSNVGILCPKGPDKAFRDMGKAVRTWPPTLPVDLHRFGERRPFVRRIEGNTVAGWDQMRNQFAPTLKWARGQRDWLWVVPDLQALADPRFIRLGKEVEWLILTLRSRDSSVWVDAQRPSWVPRASGDQARSIILFKNADLGTVDRLAEIVSLPRKEVSSLFSEMRGQDRKHDFLWFDAIEEELFYVDGHR